jgi:uncharacterized protein (TIGR03083 family)
MTSEHTAVEAVRRSHERFAALVSVLGVDDLTRPSYASAWSVAEVASHLGSQAEIFGRYLDAGLGQDRLPDHDDLEEVWGRWDAMDPVDQVTRSVAANERFVDRLESAHRAGADFDLELLGRRRDLHELARLRLGEHAVHTWDVASTLDSRATVGGEAVGHLLDDLPELVAHTGRPAEGVGPLVVRTSGPDRTYRLVTAPGVRLERVAGGSTADLVLPAEAFVRLVYGRLDPSTTPDGILGVEHLEPLRRVFPGF